MNNDADFETDLRRHLHDATDGLHAPVGFWSEVAHRGRRRLNRRRMAAGAGAAVAVVAIVAGAGMLMPPPAVPTIEPATPGDATDEEAVAPEEAEDTAEAQAEAEARDAEADARRSAVDRAAAEHRAAEEVRAMGEEFGPITGYGDFSSVPFFELDNYATTALVAQCIVDGGFDVDIVAPGDGIAFNDNDPDRRHLAAATSHACRAGLNLPEYEPANQEQLELVYTYQLALHRCLVDEGLDIPPAASLEQFLSDESWHPYGDVPDALDDSAEWTSPIDDWDEIQMRCPQQPVGGFGEWTPGEAVQPIETLPELER